VLLVKAGSREATGASPAAQTPKTNEICPVRLELSPEQSLAF
jgi:hypothetical protein